MAYIKVARTIFHFDREFLISEAIFLIRNNIVNEYSYITLKEALKYDPYSVEMLGMYAQYAMIYKNGNEALISFNKLKMIAPNSNIVKELEKIRANTKGF